jgi:amidohydrolase
LQNKVKLLHTPISFTAYKMNDSSILLPDALQSIPQNWTESVDRAVSNLTDQLIAIRRHLHRYPEPSSEEYETTQYLAEILTDAGIQIRICKDKRGIVIDSEKKDTNVGRIAFRGDIDALWIQEDNDCEYKSTKEGLMHACGHDAHAACAMGTALILQSLEKQNQLPWPVSWRGILQPAEETAVGARQLIEQGVLEDVDAIFSLHMDTSHPVGAIAVRTGAFAAACDEFHIHITGEGGHGARPHLTKDPIAAGAMIISALYQQIPRMLDAQDPAVVTIGQFDAGHSPNVIPETAVLKGTFRTLSSQNRGKVGQAIIELSERVGKAAGCNVRTKFPVGCAGVINDPGLTNILRKAAGTFPEGLEVRELAHSSMGGEDFAEYQEHVPGTMFRLGCEPESGGFPLHSPHFQIDERAIAIGVRMLTRAVILRANPEFKQTS